MKQEPWHSRPTYQQYNLRHGCVYTIERHKAESDMWWEVLRTTKGNPRVLVEIGKTLRHAKGLAAQNLEDWLNDEEV